MSNALLDKSLDKSFNSSFGTSGSDEVIINNDGGDSLSDSSDDTSYSTWKGPPPPDKRIHRYLDEMRVSVICICLMIGEQGRLHVFKKLIFSKCDKCYPLYSCKTSEVHPKNLVYCSLYKFATLLYINVLNIHTVGYNRASERMRWCGSAQFAYFRVLRILGTFYRRKLENCYM